jgi:hypothetical protein
MNNCLKGNVEHGVVVNFLLLINQTIGWRINYLLPTRFTKNPKNFVGGDILQEKSTDKVFGKSLRKKANMTSRE